MLEYLYAALRQGRDLGLWLWDQPLAMGAVGTLVALAALRFAIWPLVRRSVAIPRLAGRILSFPLTVIWMALTGLWRGVASGFRWGAGHLRRTKGDGANVPFVLAGTASAVPAAPGTITSTRPSENAQTAPRPSDSPWMGMSVYLLGLTWVVRRIEVDTSGRQWICLWPAAAKPTDPVGNYLRVDPVRLWRIADCTLRPGVAVTDLRSYFGRPLKA